MGCFFSVGAYKELINTKYFRRLNLDQIASRYPTSIISKCPLTEAATNGNGPPCFPPGLAPLASSTCKKLNDKNCVKISMDWLLPHWKFHKMFNGFDFTSIWNQHLTSTTARCPSRAAMVIGLQLPSFLVSTLTPWAMSAYTERKKLKQILWEALLVDCNNMRISAKGIHKFNFS